MNELDVSQVTRLEVIDENGRSYTKYRISDIKFSLQDDARTLKIFLEVKKSELTELTDNNKTKQKLRDSNSIRRLKECGTCGYPLLPEERIGLIEVVGIMVKPWINLTDEEVAEAVGSPIDEVYLTDFRKVESKLKEKNK